MPIDTANLASGSDDAGRPHIPHPGVIALETNDSNARFERTPSLIELCRRHTDRHRLESSDRVCHGRERPLRRSRLLAPVIRPIGPEHPAASMRLEFRRHAESVRQRR
jgi:hypothetical protein